MESGNEEMFLNSKLFNEALSQQSSHYIQSKLMSLPKEAQELKKLDLRHMCDTVVRELEVVEKEAAYDYIKVSEELQTLGKELEVADGIMEELEGVLYNFKDHLESIKSEMTSLQEKSNKMNTSLSNKKKVQNILSSFIESALPDKELIDAICLADINEAYVSHVRNLLKKLQCISSSAITPESRAVQELQPELEKLKSRASQRLRQFLLDQFKQLKKPKTNIQILQRSVLLKYKVFTEFFREQYPSIYTQLCNGYREALAGVYLSNYRTYVQELLRLHVDLYVKTDSLLANDTAHMRQFLTQIKPTSLNQEQRTIFSLMAREKAVDFNESEDVILCSLAAQKGQKFTLEQIFKSVNKALTDGVLNEIGFVAEFFNLKMDAAGKLFMDIFHPSMDVFKAQLSEMIKKSYDIYAVLLMLAINEKTKQYFHSKMVTELDYIYFDQLSFILWPKFEELFDFHQSSCDNYNVSRLRSLPPALRVVDRFADFFHSLYKLYAYFPESKMFDYRLESLKKNTFALFRKAAAESKQDTEATSYLLNIYQQFHSLLTTDGTLAKFKKSQLYQNELEKEVGTLATKLVAGLMRDHFPTLDAIVTRHYKEEAGEDEARAEWQGPIDPKLLDRMINDLANQELTLQLQRLLETCQKLYSGYSLKITLKKFNALFTKYYHAIYKYVKDHHPELVNNLLLPHNMIKEIKNALAKHLA